MNKTVRPDQKPETQNQTRPETKKKYRPLSGVRPMRPDFTECVFTFVDFQRAVTRGIMNKNSKYYTDSLYRLSNALVSCVLKKIDNSTCNQTIHRMRAERDLKLLQNCVYASNESCETGYTKDGDPELIVIDSELDQSIKTMLKSGLSNRMDIVQNTALAILETVSRLTPDQILTDDIYTDPESGDQTVVNFMTTQIIKTKLNRRVYITDFLTQSDKTQSDQIKETEYKTTELQSLCKDIRAYITEENRPEENPQKFIYIDHKIEMPDGSFECIYERFIPSVAFNFNGLETPEPDQTLDSCFMPLSIANSYKSFKELIDILSLTETQQKVLAYRLKSSGAYGAKAIATASGLSVNTVKSALNFIKVKAQKVGLVNDKIEYSDKLLTYSFNDIKLKYQQSGIMPEPPKDGVKRPIPNIKISIMNIPHRPEPELSRQTPDRLIGVYAIDKTRANKPDQTDRHILDFETDRDFETAPDVSLVCDLENPLARSENTENRATTIFDNMSDSEILLYGVYVLENRTESKKPMCDYWYKHYCDYSVRTMTPDVKSTYRPYKPDQTESQNQTESKKPKARLKTVKELEIISMYLPPRQNQR